MKSARTVKLGGVEVTRMGLGTNRLTQTQENVAFIRAAVDAGIGLVDTAHLYTGGQSEQTIGEALAGGPGSGAAVVATKGGFAVDDGRADVLRSQIETSLRKLKTGTIELYYLHRLHPEIPIEESLGVVTEFVARGQIRHIGISEVTVEQIDRARAIAPITAIQNEYNVSQRKWDGVVDYCTREGICFVPFRPVHFDDSPALAEIAQRHATTSRQIALAWLLHRSPMMVPIPGSLNIEHVKENLGALDIDLTDDEYDSLT